jgi:hypothetical protein
VRSQLVRFQTEDILAVLSPASITRLLGLIKRVTGTYRYHLTRIGRGAIAAASRITELTILPALA